MDLLSQVGDEARWLLEALLDDAARTAPPSWAQLSAFHVLRTRPPQEHPAFGTALLQWQRVEARLGEEAPRHAAQAFLALPRTAGPAERAAARLLELWVRHVPLPIEVAGRLSALERLPEPEAALVAEELALGAFERGAPSPGVLQVVAHLPGPAFGEARALAQLERFLRGDLDGEALLAALAPGLAGPEAPLPALTARLLGALRHPLAYTPEPTPALAEVLTRARMLAANAAEGEPGAGAAARIIACCAELRPAEVVALARPGRAARPQPHQRLPLPTELASALDVLDEEALVRIAWMFPALSGAVEVARGLPALTAWVAERQGRLPAAAPEREAGEREAQWSAWTGAPAPERLPAGPRDLLTRALRTGAALPRAQLQGWLDQGADRLLFDSPQGPGLLTREGELRNAFRSWPAPERLVLAHPLELNDAERQAWQGRLRDLGGRAPLNQLFRERSRPTSAEAARPRLARWRGAPLAAPGWALLAERGWFPLVAPVEVAPTLELGEVSAQLLVERLGEALAVLGVEFRAKGSAAALSAVPARAFSEAWRDVDEAVALSASEPAWQPHPARAELVQALAPALGGRLRVEAEHVALIGSPGGRVSLANALPASGSVTPLSGARQAGAALLPFEDDGGVAAVLIGRLAALRGGKGA